MEGTPSTHKSQPTYRETALWELLQFGRVDVLFFFSYFFLKFTIYFYVESPKFSHHHSEISSVFIELFFFFFPKSVCVLQKVSCTVCIILHSLKVLPCVDYKKLFVATVQKVHFVSNHHTVCAHTLKKTSIFIL